MNESLANADALPRIPSSAIELEDGEVPGLDADGHVIQWDAADGCCYNAGESLEDFGTPNLSAREIERIPAIPGAIPNQ